MMVGLTGKVTGDANMSATIMDLCEARTASCDDSPKSRKSTTGKNEYKGRYTLC